MKKLKDYFERLGKWIFESYPIIIVVIPAVMVYIFRKSLGEDGIQLCGGVLQIIGALYGLLVFVKLREVFKFPSLYELFFAWLKRFPMWRKRVHAMNGMSTAPKVIVSGAASFHIPDDPDLPIEERINRLVTNQEALRKSLETAEHNYLKNDIVLTGRIEKLEGTFSSEISHLNSKLESIHMEDFVWALSGLLFILIGSFFSIFAKYIV